MLTKCLLILTYNGKLIYFNIFVTFPKYFLYRLILPILLNRKLYGTKKLQKIKTFYSFVVAEFIFTVYKKLSLTKIYLNL